MIRLIVLDVDGTLTNGGLYYSDDGKEMKRFNVKDGVGILLAQKVGKKCMILTGKESYLVEKRAKDLQIEYIFQGIKNKGLCLANFMKIEQIKKEEILYIGDDLNDLNAMKLAGKIGCPADAAEEVKQISNYVSSYTGGNGAVRDILFTLLKNEGIYAKAVEDM